MKEKRKMHKKSVPIIHIIGLPGAGKTTLALRLSKMLKAPLFCIGRHRARFPETALGEADAWVALFRELSRRRWKNCVLETTGLNFREAFLKRALPFSQMFTIKLEASPKTLALRIRKKKKEDRGGQWFYSAEYGDKYEFMKKCFRSFCKIPANCCINTNRLSRQVVYQRAIREIGPMRLVE